MPRRPKTKTSGYGRGGENKTFFRSGNYSVGFNAIMGKFYEKRNDPVLGPSSASYTFFKPKYRRK